MLRLDNNNEKIHTVEWRIKNFSCCNMQYDEELESPTSIARNLFNTRWTVVIFPKGRADPNFLSCYLRRGWENVGPRKIRVACTFSLVRFDGVEAYTMRGIEEYERLVFKGFSKFRRMDLIYCDKETLLQSDTLTIRCTLRMVGPKNKQTSEQIFRTVFPLGKLTTGLTLDNFRGTTKQSPRILHFPDSNDLVSLKVSMNRDETSEVEIQEATTEGQNPEAPESFLDFPASNDLVSMNKDETSEAEIQEATIEGQNPEASESFLHMVMTKKESEDPIHVTCWIKLLNENSGVADSKEISYLFSETGENEEFVLPYFIDTDNLPLDCIEDYTLSIDVEITICDSILPETVRNTTPIKLRAEPMESTLMKDLECLHETSIFSDVVLLVKGKAFPAHKSILSARSPRFEEIFTSAANETTNSRQHIESIVDVDENTMAVLLKFIYTDTLEDMSDKKCLSLYSAAQKYRISSLRYRCAMLLKKKLTVRYVYEALKMAEEWQDLELNIVALDRFVDHYEYISLTPKWQTFTEEHEELANHVLQYVRFKKQ